MYGKLVISWLGVFLNPLLSTVGQVAKTLPFHSSNRSLILLRCIALRQRATASPPNGVLRSEVALMVLPLAQGSLDALVGLW